MDNQHQLHGGELKQLQTTPLHNDVEGKIFVGGLLWQTTEESMRFHFEKFGELSDIAIMIDKRTGQPRYYSRSRFSLPTAAIYFVTEFNGLL